MTDARIITREELLEFVQAERHKAFEDGYELGQKMACLEQAGVTTITAAGYELAKSLALKGMNPKLTNIGE